MSTLPSRDSAATLGIDQFRGTLLLADDEPLNLEILSEVLTPRGYGIDIAHDGLQALNLLQAAPRHYDAALLDRRMPGIDGVEIIRQIENHPDLRHLPVIMQTAAGSREDIISGLRAGVAYYLTKPLQMEMLLPIVATAVAGGRFRRQLLAEIDTETRGIECVNEAHFSYRTLDEARSLSALLARACPDPERVAMGLAELMINAVEHGNLGLGYDEKGTLTRAGRWMGEIERRLLDPRHVEKRVTVRYRRTQGEIRVSISDQGKGFDWKKYLEIAPDRAFDSHGRGIAMANKLSFSDLRFHDGGRIVEVCIRDS